MEWSHGPPAKKEPPKEEYKPETDLYQTEYERKDFPVRDCARIESSRPE